MSNKYAEMPSVIFFNELCKEYLKFSSGMLTYQLVNNIYADFVNVC